MREVMLAADQIVLWLVPSKPGVPHYTPCLHTPHVIYKPAFQLQSSEPVSLLPVLLGENSESLHQINLCLTHVIELKQAALGSV